MNLRFKAFIASMLLAVCAVSAQRIAVLSDIHVSPGSANERALRSAVDHINSQAYDMVIVNGDLTNEGSDEQLVNVKSILDGIKHKTAVLPGNHENNWSQSATKTFVDLWGNDRFVDVVDSLIVIGINCGPYMKMGDGHVKQEDLHWLRTTLDSLVTPSRRVLSFNHYPLLDDLDNLSDYLEVLNRYPVIGHVNGHYHVFRSYTPGGEEAGGDLPCMMVRALDTGKGNYGYTEINVTPDWIEVYDHQQGQPRRPVFAFPAVTKHKTPSLKPKADLDIPEGFTVEKVWTDSASVFTRLAFDNERIYFGNSLGMASAVGKADGKLQWSIPTGASLFARPVVLKKGRVAIPMHNGIVIADAKSGRKIKKYESSEGPYVADGLVTADGKAYIQGGYKRIERRSPVDGRVVWIYDSLFNYCQAAPAVDGNDLVFGAWDTNLRCLDIRNGKLRWVWNNGKTANMLGPGNVVPVITDDKVIIVAPDRYMTALDRATGTELWRDNSHRYRESLGHSADGTRVYAKTMDGELAIIDALAPEFKEIALVDLGLGYEHAPCVIVEKDGYIFTGSRRGIVTVTDAATLKHIANLQLGVSEINGIDVDSSTGDIYVSLIEGTIWRIATPQRNGNQSNI